MLRFPEKKNINEQAVENTYTHARATAGCLGEKRNNKKCIAHKSLDRKSLFQFSFFHSLAALLAAAAVVVWIYGIVATCEPYYSIND